MITSTNCGSLTSVSVLVNSDCSHKVKKLAYECGALGATVVLCKSLSSNRLIETLGFIDNKRELVFILCEHTRAHYIIHEIAQRLHFDKPNTGIAFTTQILCVKGTHSMATTQTDDASGLDATTPESEVNLMYHAIYVVVDKGRANEVTDLACHLNVKKQIVFNARGSGIHETTKLFNMDVEPEKEVVLLIAKAEESGEISEAIVKGLALEKPGNGILYIQAIDHLVGL